MNNLKAYVGSGRRVDPGSGPVDSRRDVSLR